MSRSQQIRRYIAITILLISLGFLWWGLLPTPKAATTLQVSPIEFMMPTPDAHLFGWRMMV